MSNKCIFAECFDFQEKEKHNSECKNRANCRKCYDYWTSFHPDEQSQSFYDSLRQIHKKTPDCGYDIYALGEMIYSCKIHN